MWKSFRILAAAATIAAASSMIGSPAQAALVGKPNGLQRAIDIKPPIEDVQFMWRGRRYCWYWDGWHGPGWYWCGYHWRRGSGWGGPVGWHGWRRPARPPVIHRPGGPRPGVHRPGGPRPGVNRPGGPRPGVNRPGGNRPGVNRPGGGRPSGGRPAGGRPDRS